MLKSATHPIEVQGVAVPAFMFGTAWKEEQTSALTQVALSQGFRAIDTANQRRHYFEAGVGEAVAAFVQSGRVARSDLFLQTKFTYANGQDHRLPYDSAAPPRLQVAQSFEKSIEHLQTTTIDAYLLHGPSGRQGLSSQDWEVWRAMEDLRREQRVALIGVSNVNAEQLAALLSDCRVAPTFVQNRCYARTGWDGDVRRLCTKHGVVYQGFSLLTANRREIALPGLTQIASECGRSPAQIVFRFAIQAGMIPLTGTTSSAHMREALECFDFELNQEQLNIIERLGLD
jgi:diketogulonate reductase-like aldo/keto reductase